MSNFKMAQSVLSTSNLMRDVFGISDVSRVTLTKKAAQVILTAQCQQFPEFTPTKLFNWPKNAEGSVNVIGTIGMTAMAMIDNNNQEDFKPCHEDMAAYLKFSADYAGTKYRFLHGRAKENGEPSDLLIRPDGLVQYLFDSNLGLRDEAIVKFPRTYEQISAEKGMSEEQKLKARGDVLFSVYPHYYNKSFYMNNPEALDDIDMTRAKVANALRATNPKAREGQMVQVLILGFVTGYYPMTQLRNKSLEERAKGNMVPIQPYGLGIYMPVWAILSREVVKSDYTQTNKILAKARQGNGMSYLVSLKKLGYEYTEPTKESFKDLIGEAKKIVEGMKDATTTGVETIKTHLPTETPAVKQEGKVENVSVPEGNDPGLTEVKTIVRKRAEQPKGLNLLQGLPGQTPPVASNSTGTTETPPAEKKKVPSKVKSSTPVELTRNR